ncbi:MAG: arginine--tRNA ligase [Nitrosopumilus sp. B06]|nr:MAG: arginine--tRNA ligase [Nitrosopumilus sp. D6]RNJ79383.1 MAG: arginine--tRNA ligase [Nitrosopumilus sp. B06]
MAFESFITEIQSGLKKVLDGLEISGVSYVVEPARPGFGDASSNLAFLLSKDLKKSPRDIAVMISKLYSPEDLVSGCEAHPSGYLNFTANWNRLCRIILTESVLDEYGSADVGGGSEIIVEHTSVNPNKALHIGHVRNIVVGDTISRILSRAGYKVGVLNYVDDSGLQVADIVLGFRHLGFPVEPADGKKFDHYCGDDVYVKTTEMYASDPGLENARKEVLREMEDGDSETAKFADMITQRVLACQLETCWRLSVTYDCLNFESQIIRSGLWNRIFEDLKKRNLVEFEDTGKNAGCWVIRGSGEEDKVLVRSNGTATYIAKDIPYAAWKLGLVDDPFHYVKYEIEQPGSRVLWKTVLEPNNEGGPSLAGSRVITVIDSRQARLQNIITQLMAKFKSVPDAYVHLGYESVTLSPDTAKTLGMDTGGKSAQMSGRKGLYVSADSVYDTLVERIRTETKKRHPEMSTSEIEKIARDVGVGVMRYEMIKQDLDKIIVFDLAKSQSLEGDTAPYIQYAHARAARILEKSKRDIPVNVDYSLLDGRPELALIKGIGMLEVCVRDAARNMSPKVVSRYCHDLAVAFNTFYEKSHVLNLDDENLENARLCVVNSFKITIARGLGLLGIAAPDVM